MVDVTKGSQVSSWISATVNGLGSLYGAANLAGVIGKGIGILRIKDLSDEEWDFIMGVNSTGVFKCLPEEMKGIEKGASIVSASSIAGLIGFDKNAAYVASKHAVIGLTYLLGPESTFTTGVAYSIDGGWAC